MAKPLTQEQLDARMKLVEEHVQAENKHDMNGIMATFGENPTFVLNDVIMGGCNGFRTIKFEISSH